ncbi:uncharacterized protein [Diadema antillarum]|uniref:uncharacterized protein n=1 Tax=Diadema antillarum TaxID=105358 RepID=UPI003A8956F6
MGSGNSTLFEPIPWTFDVDRTHFWVHYGFVIFGGVFALISFLVQFREPATYGKHEDNPTKFQQQATVTGGDKTPCVQLKESDDSEGDGDGIKTRQTKTKAEPKGLFIHQRFGHFLSDGPPGCILFPLVFFLYGNVTNAVNLVFLSLFMAHYIHRGLIHPWIMKYSKAKVPLWITLGGLFPNLIFSFVNADWVGSAKYSSNYYYDPRFILGVLLYVVGFITNRWADWKLRNLRSQSGGGYYIPHGGLFELVSCPNYLGELLEWMGWALATWSAAGLLWWVFGCSTFIPRSRDNHRWYKKKFDSYPPERKALIPYIF